MNKQDYLSVLLTFAFGFVAGFYLYLVGFAPEYADGRWWPDITIDRPAEEAAAGWRLVGDMYGGCLMASSCASFEIQSDRSYRYSAAPGAGVRTGVIPEDVLETLRNRLNSAPLLRYSEPIERTDCNSYVDGLDYRYTIEARDDIYTLDTCKTALPADSELAGILTLLWEYFEN